MDPRFFSVPATMRVAIPAVIVALSVGTSEVRTC